MIVERCVGQEANCPRLSLVPLDSNLLSASEADLISSWLLDKNLEGIAELTLGVNQTKARNVECAKITSVCRGFPHLAVACLLYDPLVDFVSTGSWLSR